MGAVAPVIAAGSLLGLSLLENANAARSAQKSAAQSTAAARANADIQLAKLQSDQDASTVQRESALRKAQARTRALLASRGVGGSGGAVLQGLAVEAARDQAFEQNDADLRRQSIELGVDTTQKRNLLAAGDAQRRAQLDALRSGVRTISSF